MAMESAGRRYRVVVADDHAGILEEVCQLLAPDFDVVGAANDGMALIGKTIDLRPDAVVSDIYMPGRNGIESAAEIIRQGACQAVVILSMYNEPHLVEQALGAGIRGYVLKEDASAELIPALRAAIEGRKYYSRGLDKSRKIVQPDGNL